MPCLVSGSFQFMEQKLWHNLALCTKPRRIVDFWGDHAHLTSQRPNIQERMSQRRLTNGFHGRKDLNCVIRCRRCCRPSSVVCRLYLFSSQVRTLVHHISTFYCIHDSAGLQDGAMVTRDTAAMGRMVTGGTTATGDKWQQGSAGRRDDGNGRHNEVARWQRRAARWRQP